MKKLLENCINKDFNVQLENYYQTYYYMLKYSFELSDDPEKEKIYQKLRKSLIELLDDAKEDIIFNKKLLSYYNIKKELMQFTRDESEDLVEFLELEEEINRITGFELRINNNKIFNDYKRSIERIFKHIWLCDDFKEAEIELVNRITKAKDIPWYDKAILVSALTLSSLRHFDLNKIMLLIDIYEQGEHQVWQRAMIGWVISLFYYDSRLIFYPELINRLKAMQGDKFLETYIEMIIIQFIRAKETEKVTKKIQEEIIPDMLKIRTKFDDKLNLEELLSMSNFEDKNPQWENFFKDSPDLYKKMEEFYNLQIEGADVFMGAFGMLKRFDFFSSIGTIHSFISSF